MKKDKRRNGTNSSMNISQYEVEIDYKYLWIGLIFKYVLLTFGHILICFIEHLLKTTEPAKGNNKLIKFVYILTFSCIYSTLSLVSNYIVM